MINNKTVPSTTQVGPVKEKTVTAVVVKASPKSVDLTRESNPNKLRFSPYAYAKFQWLRDRSKNEVGAFGLSRIDDPTYIHDVRLPKQEVGPVSVEFDENELPNYLDDMVDEGYQPAECSRIWLHTHPGMAASPSGTDTSTFDEAFSKPDWAIMCILGESEITARLRLNESSGHFSLWRDLKVEIDCTGNFLSVTEDAVTKWEKEYTDRVAHRVYHVTSCLPQASTYPGFGFGDVDEAITDRWYKQAWDEKVSDDNADTPSSYTPQEDAYGGSGYVDTELETYRSELMAARAADGIIAIVERDSDMIDFDDIIMYASEEYITDTFHVDELVFVCMENSWFAYYGEPADLANCTDIISQAADVSRTRPIAYGELSWFSRMNDNGEPVIRTITTAHDELCEAGHIDLLLVEARDYIAEHLMDVNRESGTTVESGRVESQAALMSIGGLD